MKIGDNISLNQLSKIQLAQMADETGDGKAPGRFDELFNTVFAASNSTSQELSQASRESTALLMTGELDDLSGHLVTNEKSGMAFELNLNIRNKVLDAYNEIMKTQI